MKRKPVVPREQANHDVDEAIAYYLTEANEAVALGFIDALEKPTAPCNYIYQCVTGI